MYYPNINKYNGHYFPHKNILFNHSYQDSMTVQNLTVVFNTNNTTIVIPKGIYPSTIPFGFLSFTT